jgi:hypothetical protein
MQKYSDTGIFCIAVKHMTEFYTSFSFYWLVRHIKFHSNSV